MFVSTYGREAMDENAAPHIYRLYIHPFHEDKAKFQLRVLDYDSVYGAEGDPDDVWYNGLLRPTYQSQVNYPYQ